MNATTHNTAMLAARILMGLLFLLSGWGKLGGVDGFAQYMAAGGLPAFLAWPAVLFEILGGLALILGFQTRIVALALAAFCVVTAVMYHGAEQTQLLKNLAMAGGYIAIAAAGAGAWSLDRVMGRSTAAAA